MPPHSAEERIYESFEIVYHMNGVRRVMRSPSLAKAKSKA